MSDKLHDIFANLPEFTHRDLNMAELKRELDATPETIGTRTLPRLYQLETTSKCNLACPFCPRTTDLLKNKQRSLKDIMSLDKFEHVLNQMPWLRSLELFHFGEPFMHDNFHEYVAACKRRGIYVVVASNLLKATNEKLDAAFDAGLDFLVMDCDSLNAERYAGMRVGGKLEVLHDRVKYILAHPKRPYCVAQTIMLDGVPEYTEEQFVEWTGGLKPDEVRYKFLDSFRGEATKAKGGLGPDDLCREPFYGFTVHVNGNVVPCDRDWAGENVVGNVFEEDILKIWRGEKFEAFRAAMRSKDKPAMCKRCPEGRLFNARSQPMIQVNMFRGAEVEAS